MFLLIIILFAGDVMTTSYPTIDACADALFQKTDNGNFKKIKVASCINAENLR